MEDKSFKAVDVKKRVIVYGTGKSKFFPKGAARKVHYLKAAEFVKSGIVTLAMPEGVEITANEKLSKELNVIASGEKGKQTVPPIVGLSISK